MCLRYMNKKRAVNLDNFDFIEVEKVSRLEYRYPKDIQVTVYQVVAVRLCDKIKSTSAGGGGSLYINTGSCVYTNSDGLVKYMIKEFNNEQEANKFYDNLQYHWINNIGIFEIEC